MREKKLQGFTLTELVIGIAIMGFVIISVLAVFFNGINAIKKGRYQSSAVNMLESKISQTRLLLLKCPDVKYDVTAKVPTVIKGDITSISPAPAIVWNEPNSPSVPVKIEGKDSEFNFIVLIDEYEPVKFNYRMKKITVQVSRDSPPVSLTMTTLIGSGI